MPSAARRSSDGEGLGRVHRVEEQSLGAQGDAGGALAFGRREAEAGAAGVDEGDRGGWAAEQCGAGVGQRLHLGGGFVQWAADRRPHHAPAFWRRSDGQAGAGAARAGGDHDRPGPVRPAPRRPVPCRSPRPRSPRPGGSGTGAGRRRSSSAASSNTAVSTAARTRVAGEPDRGAGGQGESQVGVGADRPFAVQHDIAVETGRSGGDGRRRHPVRARAAAGDDRVAALASAAPTRNSSWRGLVAGAANPVRSSRFTRIPGRRAGTSGVGRVASA